MRTGEFFTGNLLNRRRSRKATTVTADSSPRKSSGFVIVFQGTEDVLVGTVGAFEFMRAMHAADVPCEVHYFAGANHEFDMTPFYTDACIAATEAFLHRHVTDPKGAAQEILQTNPLAAMAQVVPDHAYRSAP